jgi:hypothetical protein
MKHKAVTILVLVVVASFLAFFVLVPVEWVDTRPSTVPDQLAFLQIPSRESLSCVVFGVGASDWPVWNSTTYQYYTYQYRMGCPSPWTSVYSYTVST